MAHHVCVAGYQVQALDPDHAHVYLDPLRVHADHRDRAALPRHAAGGVERRWVADRVDCHVHAAHLGAALYGLAGILLGRVHGLGAQLACFLEAPLHGVDRDHLRSPGRSRGHHRAQPDRAEADHRARIARLEASGDDGVVARSHHVAGEQRGAVREPLGHAPQRQVRTRH